MSSDSRAQEQPPNEFAIVGLPDDRLQWVLSLAIPAFATWVAFNADSLTWWILLAVVWCIQLGSAIPVFFRRPRGVARLTPDSLDIKVPMTFRSSQFQWDNIADVEIERLRPRRILGVASESGNAGAVRIRLRRRTRLVKSLVIRPQTTQAFVDAALSHRQRFGPLHTHG